MKGRIPLKKAILWILLSIIGVTGTATLGWFYYLRWIHLRETDSAYNIRIIAQTHLPGGRVDTDYLAEALALSKDNPVNLYSLHLGETEKQLLANPIFKTVALEKIKPDMLYIDYQLRIPIAYLGDYTNVAIDEEGVMIPFLPFFTPKNLPKIYLGENLEGIWGFRIQSEKYLLCRDLMKTLKSFELNIKSIDVSRIDMPSCGDREIVVFIEEMTEKDRKFVISPIILRLSPGSYGEALGHYSRLRKVESIHNPLDVRGIRQPVKIIDLRVENLAFIMRTNT